MKGMTKSVLLIFVFEFLLAVKIPLFFIRREDPRILGNIFILLINITFGWGNYFFLIIIFYFGTIFLVNDKIP